jgi:hypothetical protein
MSGPTSWDPTASSAQFSAPAQAKPAKHKQPAVNPLRPFSGFSQGSVDSTGTLALLCGTVVYRPEYRMQCWGSGYACFLGLPDPLVRVMDPDSDPDPDPSIFS